MMSLYGREKVRAWKILRPRRHEPLKCSLERTGNGNESKCVERAETRTRVSLEGWSNRASLCMGQRYGGGKENPQKAPY